MGLASVIDEKDPEGSLKWAGGAYHSGAKFGDLTALTYGYKIFTVIAWSSEDEHEQLIKVHRMIAFRMSEELMLIRTLMERHTTVETALEKLRSRLMPSVIRLKVLRGH